MRTVVLIRREARLGSRKLHRASGGTNRTASSGVYLLDDCLVGSHEQRCCAALWRSRGFVASMKSFVDFSQGGSAREFGIFDESEIVVLRFCFFGA
jgi:hypothetical protein